MPVTRLAHAEFVTRTRLACARAGLDLSRKFDPAEARDPHGRWVRGPGGSGHGKLPWTVDGDNVQV